MKHGRITAIILVLVMLLGTLPAALAEQASSTDTFCSKTMNGQHSWGDWRITKEAACTRDGARSRTCGRCGYTQTESIKKTGHKWGSWQTTKEATCTKKGEQTRKCGVCGKKETRDIDKKAHTWGEWTVTVEPTDFTMGTKVHTCKACGTEGSADFYPDPTYKKGDKGTGVKGLQEKLNAAGYDCGKADGDFGKKTEAAVKALEEAHGFTADGIAWPGVQKWLTGKGEYGWEPPVEEEVEPEGPEGSGGPAGEVSPATLEPSELYDVTVQVQDTTGMKYIMDPVEVQITFTNTGSKAVDVCCEGVGSDLLIWPESALVACTAGELKGDYIGSRWEARLKPGEFDTVTVRVSLMKEDMERGWIERSLTAWFTPTEAADSGTFPKDWPWEEKQRELDASFRIDLGDPALKLDVYGQKYERTGNTLKIGMTAYNHGPHTLYNWEVDVYEWDKDTGDYVYSETLGPLEQIRNPRPIAPNYYWFWGLSKEIEITEQTVADSDSGIIRFAFRARSWTKDGTPVESELQTKEVFVYNAGIYLEAEDTSAGQIPEDGWVKVKLTATNIGTEIMSLAHEFCKIDEAWSFYTDSQLYDNDTDWMTPGASDEMELWIKVYDVDVKAGKVYRLESMDFKRRHGKDGKTLPADTVEGHYYGTDYHFYTNVVEIVIPLLEAPKEPQPEPRVTPPPAPDAVAHCTAELTGLGDGTAEWTLTRCPEHRAVVKAANKLLEEAEDDEVGLAAREAVVRLWTDALNAEYEAMFAEAGAAEKALIEAEKTAFEAQLAARQAALAAEVTDPVRAAEEIAELLMLKTSELCYERRAAPEERADLRTAAGEALPSAEETWPCGRSTHETGAVLYLTETLCPEHRAIDGLAAEARDADGWAKVKKAWLDALDAQANIRWLDADEAGQALITAERLSFGDWLEAREVLLDRLYPSRPALVQELLARAIRARVAEYCGH